MNYRQKTTEMLQDYEQLKASIVNMTNEIFEIEQEESTVSGVRYDKEKLSNSYNTNSSTEDEAINNLTKIELLNKKIEITESKVSRLSNALYALNETERYIIVNKIVKSRPYFKFTHEVNISERHCRRIKNIAIEKIVKALYGDKEVRAVR